ncbi:MAG TPA: hypothetical protein ENJ35_04300 [Gammaproteobacteria bacterium]|nr:hypothetical protein [Gammaproteobacteria bacterium]
MSDILFASVKDAVRWSEEIALIPDVSNCLSGLISKPSCGNMSRQEMIDIALTISAITASCKPYCGQALKAVYSGRDDERDETLGLVIASRLMKTPHGAQKDLHKLVLLGTSTIVAMRSYELYGKHYPKARMASDVGVSRQRFMSSLGWPILRRLARDQLAVWMNQATNEIWNELRDRDWIA